MRDHRQRTHAHLLQRPQSFTAQRYHTTTEHPNRNGKSQSKLTSHLSNMTHPHTYVYEIR